MVRRDLGNRGSVSLDAAKVCVFAFVITTYLINFSHGRFSRHFWGAASPTFESLHTTKYIFLVCSCLYNGKFTVTTFKSRLNCLEFS
jgi:hypothetical protein